MCTICTSKCPPCKSLKRHEFDPYSECEIVTPTVFIYLFSTILLGCCGLAIVKTGSFNDTYVFAHCESLGLLTNIIHGENDNWIGLYGGIVALSGIQNELWD
jgi:hypothetical protein